MHQGVIGRTAEGEASNLGKTANGRSLQTGTARPARIGSSATCMLYAPLCSLPLPRHRAGARRLIAGFRMVRAARPLRDRDDRPERDRGVDHCTASWFVPAAAARCALYATTSRSRYCRTIFE